MEVYVRQESRLVPSRALQRSRPFVILRPVSAGENRAASLPDGDAHLVAAGRGRAGPVGGSEGPAAGPRSPVGQPEGTPFHDYAARLRGRSIGTRNRQCDGVIASGGVLDRAAEGNGSANVKHSGLRRQSHQGFALAPMTSVASAANPRAAKATTTRPDLNRLTSSIRSQSKRIYTGEPKPSQPDERHRHSQPCALTAIMAPAKTPSG